MTCRTCQPWAAISHKQLAIRLRNMRDMPENPLACPSCGGRDWATTEEFLPPAPPRSLLQRVFGFLGWLE